MAKKKNVLGRLLGAAALAGAATAISNDLAVTLANIGYLIFVAGISIVPNTSNPLYVDVFL